MESLGRSRPISFRSGVVVELKDAGAYTHFLSLTRLRGRPLRGVTGLQLLQATLLVVYVSGWVCTNPTVPIMLVVVIVDRLALTAETKSLLLAEASAPHKFALQARHALRKRLWC